MKTDPKGLDFILNQRNRREVVVGIASTYGLLALEGCKPRGTSQGDLAAAGDPVVGRTRLSLKNLESSDPDNIIKNYDLAVGIMKKLPTSDPRNWTAQARTHQDWCPHGNWFFFPWHRGYLFYFEETIRSVLLEKGDKSAAKQKEYKNWALPYWDWTLYNSFPKSFTQGGGFQNLVHPKRKIGSPNTPINAVGEAIINRILNVNDFFGFAGSATKIQMQNVGSGQLEGTPHNTIHNWISGDMGSMMSPIDPIFWLHHCNVDRLWNIWTAQHQTQALPPDSSTQGGAAISRQYFLSMKMSQYYDPTTKKTVQPTIKAIYDEISLKYGYDRAGFGSPQGSVKAMANARGFDPTKNKDTEAVPESLEVSAPYETPVVDRQQAGDNYMFAINADEKVKNGLKKFREQTKVNEDFTVRCTAKNIPCDFSNSFTFHLFMRDSDVRGLDLNHKELAESSHYVGSYSFFMNHDHGAENGDPVKTRDFVFDMKQVINKVYPEGTELGEKIYFYLAVRTLDEQISRVPIDIDAFENMKLIFEFVTPK